MSCFIEGGVSLGADFEVSIDVAITSALHPLLHVRVPSSDLSPPDSALY